VGVGLRLILANGQNPARLHKVLSGGGGWGAKKGLLSLDPDTSFSRQSTTSTIGENIEDQDLQGVSSHALDSVAEPGDFVMFFLAPPNMADPEIRRTLMEPTAPQEVDDGLDWDLDALSLSPTATLFGTLPSSIDEPPTNKSESPDSNRKEPKITHNPNLFGMLSESGMAVTFSRKDGGGEVSTKLDVPFVRFSVAKRAENKRRQKDARTALRSSEREAVTNDDDVYIGPLVGNQDAARPAKRKITAEDEDVDVGLLIRKQEAEMPVVEWQTDEIGRSVLQPVFPKYSTKQKGDAENEDVDVDLLGKKQEAVMSVAERVVDKKRRSVLKPVFRKHNAKMSNQVVRLTRSANHVDDSVTDGNIEDDFRRFEAISEDSDRESRKERLMERKTEASEQRKWRGLTQGPALPIRYHKGTPNGPLHKAVVFQDEDNANTERKEDSGD
jgi:hypothetical protein